MVPIPEVDDFALNEMLSMRCVADSSAGIRDAHECDVIAIPQKNDCHIFPEDDLIPIRGVVPLK
jgi:hypothetical protein